MAGRATPREPVPANTGALHYDTGAPAPHGIFGQTRANSFAGWDLIRRKPALQPIGEPKMNSPEFRLA